MASSEPAAPGDRASASESARGIVTRFAIAYLLVFLFPFPLGLVPGTEDLAKRYSDLLDSAMPWIGTRVLGFDAVPIQPTGSGDTASSYTHHFCFLVVAAAATAVWTAVVRGRPSAERAVWPWVRVYLRYWLAAVLIGYAVVKILKSQFPFPRPETLLLPLGQASPMGLLWRFMGYSTAYNVFTGLAEIAPAVLLFFRRTTTLGALLAAAVMANVAMLNFSYDVPVKLLSVQLFLFALVLLIPDARRLARVLVLNRPAPAADLSAPAIPARLRRFHLPAKLVLLAAVLFLAGRQAWQGYTKWGDGASHGPLYGAYEVEAFVKDGEEVAPLTTAKGCWRRVAVNDFEWIVFHTDDSLAGWGFEYDEPTSKLTFVEGDTRHALDVTRPDPDHVVLEGPLGKSRVTVRLRKIDLGRMELVKRGFRWVNERPYHR